ncbi:MAG: hypothetical protein ABR536_02520 [Solirubrobacterales bacterium]
MSDKGVEELVSSLLYEGYALYPYTPGVKNATPTPFGIVYPAGYAAAQPAAYPELRLECILEGGPEAEITGTVRFLQAAGEGHKGIERRLDLGTVKLADLAREKARQEFGFPREAGAGSVRGRAVMEAEMLGPELARIKLCVHNDTEIAGDVPEAEVPRGDALQWSLLSVHPMVEVDDSARFISPLERDGEAGAAVEASDSFNTFPVLVGKEDRAVLGAAIVVPEHPELAPESLGNLFDNTEIEEALLLHVQVLSDDEREQISEQDPAVREMIERAEKTTNDEMMSLHGRLTYTEPEDDGRTTTPPTPPPGMDEIQGETTTEVKGATVKRGDTIILRPGTEGAVEDKMLDGRRATVERIYKGMDERVYLGVTIADVPGQDLLSDTGRFLFFFSDEVELIA